MCQTTSRLSQTVAMFYYAHLEKLPFPPASQTYSAQSAYAQQLSFHSL